MKSISTILNNEWVNFFTLLASLVIIFLVALLVIFILDKVLEKELPRRIIKKVRLALKYLYWPIASIILLANFVYINPIYHGLILLFSIAISFRFIREYIAGIFIMFSTDFSISKVFKIEGKNAILSKIGWLGASFNSNEGVMFIPYTKLLKENNLTITKGQKETNVYQFQLEIHKEASIQVESDLMRILFYCPFINWNIKPRLLNKNDRQLQFEVFSKKGVNENDILAFLKEYSNSVKAINNN